MTETPAARTIKPVVAIVDNDPAVCSSLKFSLELEGFSVRVFHNGAELADAEKLLDYACFVVDQILPDTGGLQLIETLRSRQIATPAILIIGHPYMRLAAQAAAAGVPIVEKPLVGNTLLAKIREACKIAN